MKFSDEKLGEVERNARYWLRHGRPFVVKESKDTLALIARLKAAERALDLHAQGHCGMRWWHEAVKVWRKRAGK